MRLKDFVEKVKRTKEINLSMCQQHPFEKVVARLKKEERDEIKKVRLSDSFPKEIFLLPNLTKIDLSISFLEEVPKEIGKLSELVELNLSSNENLISIPKEIGQLSKLRILNLEGTRVKEIPKEIGQLSDLRVLKLTEAGVEEIPKEIGQLSKLKELDLSFNKISRLPKELYQLSNLKELYLGANEIAEIPQEIGQLSKLVRLHLHNNNLLELPMEIGKLTHLKYMDISNNSLSSLPQTISQLHNLKILDLYGNKFAKIPKEIKNLANLEDLYFELQKVEDFINKDIIIQPNKGKSTIETKVRNKLKKELFKLLTRFDRIFEKHDEIMDSDALALTCTEVRKAFIRDENADESEDAYSEEQCLKGFNKEDPWFFGAFSNEGNYQMGKALSIYLKNANELIKYLGETTPKFRLSVFRTLEVMTKEGNINENYFGFRLGRLEDEDGYWEEYNRYK